MFDIGDKVAIVTGAAGGIGLAVAQEFARLGAKLALVDVSESAEAKILSALPETKHKPLIMCEDLLQQEAIDRVADRTEAEWGRIDILVNSAGVNVRKPANEYTREEWDWVLGVNLKAIFFLTARVAETMKRQSYGKIINISSIQGVISWTGVGRFSLAPYGASKAGLIDLTRSFALDLAKYNITVNAICPGFVDTELVAKVKSDQELYGDIIARTPIGRFAKPSEIVGPIVFVASDASSYVTGHPLLVDGGWVAQ